MTSPIQDSESLIKNKNKNKCRIERIKPVKSPEHVKNLSAIFNNAIYQGKHIAIKKINEGIEIIAYDTSLDKVIKKARRVEKSTLSTLFVEKKNTLYLI